IFFNGRKACPPVTAIQPDYSESAGSSPMENSLLEQLLVLFRQQVRGPAPVLGRDWLRVLDDQPPVLFSSPQQQTADFQASPRQRRKSLNCFGFKSAHRLEVREHSKPSGLCLAYQVTSRRRLDIRKTCPYTGGHKLIPKSM